MRKTNVAIGAALLISIALAGGWYFLSPGWTVKAMVDAAKAGDADRFSSYVDYPALRADMKTELGRRLEAETKGKNSAETRLGLAMGMAMMGPLVDQMVSPEAMQTALAALADAPKNGAVQKGSGEADRASGGSTLPEIHRQGFDRFLLAKKGKADAALVFERRGLGWKLVGIELPAAMNGKAGGS